MMNHAIDPAKSRREAMRWALLLTLNNSRPLGAHEALILSTIQGVFPDATQHELRRELDYLGDRSLVTLKIDPSGPWSADLTRLGVDIVEYTVDCQPGIARPAKYY